MTIKSEDFMLCQSVTEDEAKLMNEKDNMANIKSVLNAIVKLKKIIKE